MALGTGGELIGLDESSKQGTGCDCLLVRYGASDGCSMDETRRRLLVTLPNDLADGN